jgi:anti-sigma regulatory factor (Ser/Thr protein kinase)
MPDLERSFNIKFNDFSKAGEVSIEVQRILKNIGFDPGLIRRVCVCAYESEMNVVMHGGDGVVLLTVDPETVVIDIRDDGPGIDDVELALQEGYSTASMEHQEMGFGAGMGLPNIKKNADSLEVKSVKGEGTHLKMEFMVG